MRRADPLFPFKKKMSQSLLFHGDGLESKALESDRLLCRSWASLCVGEVIILEPLDLF